MSLKILKGKISFLETVENLFQKYPKLLILENISPRNLKILFENYSLEVTHYCYHYHRSNLDGEEVGEGFQQFLNVYENLMYLSRFLLSYRCWWKWNSRSTNKFEFNEMISTNDLLCTYFCADYTTHKLSFAWWWLWISSTLFGN